MPEPLTSDDSRNASRAVIFDMDGTLTRPYLDFAAIRREIGLADDGVPILESLERMAPEARAAAELILHRHEAGVAGACELWEDAADVVQALQERGLLLGLLTRNSRASTALVLGRHALEFDCVHTREDGPVKPAPDAVLGMCRRWSVEPSHVWVVGDYLFDIQAGRAAGTRTALMIGDEPMPEYAALADRVIRRLSELLTVL
jgi:HAD superfamily hydrolase (TIGR01549 family)